MELNKVLLVGRLTRDPELRQTNGGNPVASFGLASNTTFGSGDNKREDTLFVEVSIFGKQAEIVNTHLEKGRQIYVEGRLNLDSWEKDGQKRSRITVIADRFQFMGGRNEDSQNEAAPAAANAGSAGDDDLPF